MIHFITHIRAVTKGRPRLGRRRKAYTPARTLAFEAAVGEAFVALCPDQEPLVGPLGMQVIIGSNHIEVQVWELEASCRPKYITGDLDNYQKAIQDGLNKLAYVDDKQIQHLEVFFTKEELEVIGNDGTV